MTKAHDGGKRWTKREWALIARHARYRREHGDPRDLCHIILEAQARSLQPERHRSLSGLRQAFTSRTLPRLLDEAMADIWTLSEPFAPDGVVIESMPAQAQPHPAAAVTEPAVAEPHHSAPALETADAPGPAPEPAGPQINALPAATTPPETPQEPPEAPETAAAGEQYTVPTLDSSRPARQFCLTLIEGLDRLLRDQAREQAGALLSLLDERLDVSLADMQLQLDDMAAGIRLTVHDTIEQLVGGPATQPTAAPAPQPTPPTPVEPPPREPVVRVDVVGLVGNNIELVRRAFNGHTELRFVDVDQLNGYTPSTGRHVVQAVRWVPHSLKGRLKAAHVRPVTVKGSVGSVIEAIEELHRLAGISPI